MKSHWKKNLFELLGDRSTIGNFELHVLEFFEEAWFSDGTENCEPSGNQPDDNKNDN